MWWLAVASHIPIYFVFFDTGRTLHGRYRGQGLLQFRLIWDFFSNNSATTILRYYWGQEYYPIVPSTNTRQTERQTRGPRGTKAACSSRPTDCLTPQADINWSLCSSQYPAPTPKRRKLATYLGYLSLTQPWLSLQPWSPNLPRIVFNLYYCILII